MEVYGGKQQGGKGSRPFPRLFRSGLARGILPLPSLGSISSYGTQIAELRPRKKQREARAHALSPHTPLSHVRFAYRDPLPRDCFAISSPGAAMLRSSTPEGGVGSLRARVHPTRKPNYWLASFLTAFGKSGIRTHGTR